jgi:phage baseplate assembly protein W
MADRPPPTELGATISGPRFPFTIDPSTGRVAVSSGSQKLKENLIHLLLTNIGERLMARQYGGGISALLHENVNDALLAVARHQVGRAILQFEPRVLPQQIDVTPDGATVVIRIEYLEAATATTQSAVITVG